MILVEAVNVPPGSSLGYTLLRAGQPVSARQTAGIQPADGGASGGQYIVLVDETVCDAVAWDTGGQNPVSWSVSLLVASAPLPLPPPVLATIEVPVTYAPDPATAAILITENGMNEGPFPCAVSGPAEGGTTYALTASLTTLPAGLGPGEVSVQPGDVAGGVFTPNGQPDTGKLTLSGGAAAQDIAWTAGPAQTDVTSEASGTLLAGSDDFLHLLVQATSSLDGSAVDVSLAAVEIAVVRAFPQEGDWQEATWLVRTADPAGTYAHIAASALMLFSGSYSSSSYWVYVRITLGAQQWVLRAPGTLRVRG